MNKSNAKNLYESYWLKTTNKFEDYFRNKDLLSLFHNGEKILDVGCGDGTVDQYLKDHVGVDIVGVDISKEAIKKAKHKGLEALVCDVEKRLPFKNETFDTVFWGDNIEHLFDPKTTAREIRRVLKKNGKLVLSCPNMGYLRYRIYYLIHGILPDTEWTGFPNWNWSHIRFFNLTLLIEFLKQNSFPKINKVVGLSPRRLDKPFLTILPSIFGMVLLVEAS